MNVYMLLDRSGSMHSAWAETIGSINGYVKALPKEAKVFLAAFDNIGYDVVRNTNAGLWQDISPTEVIPRGGTPLYDAAARLMHRALDDNSEKTVMVVLTDGEENQSQHFRQQHIVALTARLEAKKWEVLYLGANFTKIADVARSTGVLNDTKYMNMTPLNYNATMRSVGTATASYLSGVTQTVDFTAAMKADAVKQ